MHQLDEAIVWLKPRQSLAGALQPGTKLLVELPQLLRRKLLNGPVRQPRRGEPMPLPGATRAGARRGLIQASRSNF